MSCNVMKEIALHILDIAENCIAAGGKRVIISIVDEPLTDIQTIRIEDNGKGMSEEEIKRTSDPFYTSRTTRRVGLGIPLFRQHAEMTGGELRIQSEKGFGTTVEATFHKGHADRQPMGDLEGSWVLLATSNPAIEWEMVIQTGKGHFSISTSEIRQELGLDVIRGTEITSALKRMIRNNLDELGLE